jgi:hypothetical protein
MANMSSLPDSPKKGMGTRRNSNLSLFGENHLVKHKKNFLFLFLNGALF